MIRIFCARFSRDGRDSMESFKTRTAAIERAQELARDPQIIGAISVMEYSAAGTAFDALLAVMSTASQPREAWADKRRTLTVVVPPGLRVMRGAAAALK